MNKTDLVNVIAEKAGLTKIEAKKALDATIDAIVETVKKDEKVALIGFGTFETVTRSARKGINPLTKQFIEIPEKKQFKFKASSNILG